MCQYDAYAKPIMDWSDRPANDEPYTAIMPNEAYFKELNPRSSTSQPLSPETTDARKLTPEIAARLSSQMDFDHADAAPADLVGQIIWQSIKGWGDVMPRSPGGPLIEPKAARRDDDD
jgi:hypothetical protein